MSVLFEKYKTKSSNGLTLYQIPMGEAIATFLELEEAYKNFSKLPYSSGWSVARQQIVERRAEIRKLLDKFIIHASSSE